MKFQKSYLLSVISVVVVSNLVAVIVFPTLSFFSMRPQSYEQFLEINSTFIFNILVNGFSFVFAIALTVLYIWPIIKFPSEISKKGKNRLLNAPIIISILTISSWVVGSINAQLYIVFNAIETSFLYNLQMHLISIVLGSITFIISYYCMEYLNRRFFIPQVFPQANLVDLKDAYHISIRSKLYIFLFAVFILPVTVLLSLIYNLNNDGLNIFQKNIMLPVLILFSFSFLLSLLITFMKANSIEKPLMKLEKLAQEINNGNYDVQLSLDSPDAIGKLTDSMNKMAIGLLERERIRDVFGKMVDPKVRDHLINGDLKLGGELREVSILFSDIKDFTAFSEYREPDEVVTLLNRYFEKMAACITAEGGVINKFIGDSIMAVFGAPVEIPNSADSALRAGIAMLKAQEQLKYKFASEGKMEIISRIGIHTGQVLAGNLGTSDRMEYTVIGDVVNTASRLESLCKDQNCNLLTSSDTVNKILDKSLVKYISRIKVKGKEDLIDVFGLV